MKAMLFVVENDADLTQAKALIEKLMGSNDPANLARMTAIADQPGFLTGSVLQLVKKNMEQNIGH
jgi:hypothetical protein